MAKRWYAKDTGSDQALVIDEETGRSVAVVYDPKDADLLAAAPEMLESLEWCIGWIEEYEQYISDGPAGDKEAYRAVRAVMYKAKGE